MIKKVFKTILNGRDLIVETGYLAKQAAGSVLVRYGDTVILATVTVSEVATANDFFPLTVVFQEKLYSVGKIPGGFLKREGKPSEYATLSARLIDRALRPLFPEGFRNEVQVVINVFSVDNDNDVRVAGMFGASLAIGISKVPFFGPVSSVLVTIDSADTIIVNPSLKELNLGKMELLVAGTGEAINMVEASCQEISEELILDSIIQAHEVIKSLNNFQNQIIKEIGVEKQEMDYFTIEEPIINFVNCNYKDKLISATNIFEKSLRKNEIKNVMNDAIENYLSINHFEISEIEIIKLKLDIALNDVIKEEVRRQIVKDKTRVDGRTLDEIRPITCEINLLPVVHGSALFTRGETQVLSIVTLGALGENQVIDGITDEDVKRFMHHYNFPPFCTGETKRMGQPSRREIGHGALGEKALLQIIPDETVFPYTIRVVSEVLESNGSSSQASICASTMALMAAGVPIKSPVAGIAMGLVKTGSDYTILTDIQGLEDHLGDMDFKVAGTKDGICALQMDIKIIGINRDILQEALNKAKTARLFVLQKMLDVIPTYSKELSPTAPKMITFNILPDKIREVIGAGGKVINQIIERSDNVKIDISDNGQVTIYHRDYDSIKLAEKMILNIATPISVGQNFIGKVVKIEKFGAFINIKENLDGLLHISKLSDTHVKNVEDILTLGDKVKVEVIEIDSKNKKIKLKLIEKLDKNN